MKPVGGERLRVAQRPFPPRYAGASLKLQVGDVVDRVVHHFPRVTRTSRRIRWRLRWRDDVRAHMVGRSSRIRYRCGCAGCR